MGREFEVVYESGVLRPLEPLPFAENQRLRVTVNEEDASARPDIYRVKEMEWLRLHAKEYEGEYVAVFGDRLVAHAKKGLDVFKIAREQGVERPLVTYISPQDEPPFGGW